MVTRQVAAVKAVEEVVMWQARDRVVVVENLGGGVGEEELRGAFEVGGEATNFVWLVQKKKNGFVYKHTEDLVLCLKLARWYTEYNNPWC